MRGKQLETAIMQNDKTNFKESGIELQVETQKQHSKKQESMSVTGGIDDIEIRESEFQRVNTITGVAGEYTLEIVDDKSEFGVTNDNNNKHKNKKNKNKNNNTNKNENENENENINTHAAILSLTPNVTQKSNSNLKQMPRLQDAASLGLTLSPKVVKKLSPKDSNMSNNVSPKLITPRFSNHQSQQTSQKDNQS